MSDQVTLEKEIDLQMDTGDDMIVTAPYGQGNKCSTKYFIWENKIKKSWMIKKSHLKFF